MPEHVERLKDRKELDFHIDPDSNKAKALAFLAADEKVGYRPSEIAARTDIPESSVTKTMQRLMSEGHVAAIDSYYYIPDNKLDKIRRVLTDTHSGKHLAENPDAEVTWDEPEADAEDAAAEIVDEVATEIEADETDSQA
jgi:DNA-binding MarR family transcriptional regulator